MKKRTKKLLSVDDAASLGFLAGLTPAEIDAVIVGLFRLIARTDDPYGGGEPDHN